jgi:hypothetical protein
MSNPIWWIADTAKAMARIESAIAGKADSDMVRLPLGDARPEPVSSHKARYAAMANNIADAIAEYGMPVVACEREGFKRFANGGGTYVYRKKFAKAELVVSGFDGDLPSDGWWLICAYENFDEYDSPCYAIADDDSADGDKPTFEPKSFTDALAKAIASVS